MTVARVVAGIDGSLKSLDAVRWAARDALLRSVPLTIVTCLHAHTPSFSDAISLRSGNPKVVARLAERTLASGEDAARELVGDTVEISTLVEHGSAAEVLVRGRRYREQSAGASRGIL